MSKGKDTVLVCLIDHILPGDTILQKLTPELLHRPPPHPPPRGQHEFPGGSAPDPSAIAFSALAAGAAAVSCRVYTPTCRHWYQGSRTWCTPEPGSCHLQVLPPLQSNLGGHLGAARCYAITRALPSSSSPDTIFLSSILKQNK